MPSFPTVQTKPQNTCYLPFAFLSVRVSFLPCPHSISRTLLRRRLCLLRAGNNKQYIRIPRNISAHRNHFYHALPDYTNRRPILGVSFFSLIIHRYYVLILLRLLHRRFRRKNSLFAPYYALPRCQHSEYINTTHR